MKVTNVRGREMHRFETDVRDAMYTLRINREQLSDKINYNDGGNLMTAIKNRNLSDAYLVKLCKVLKLDLGKMFVLKVKNDD